MIRASTVLFVVGTFLIALIGWVLLLTSPMPNGLSSPHAAVDVLASQAACQSCHDEGGLTTGCLHCHTEIQDQLSKGKGYHSYLQRQRAMACESCHHEHFGPDYQLVNIETWGAQVPRAFKHPHVEFGLTGKHSVLSCEECHESTRQGQLVLPGFISTPREKSFLGLEQECRACHADVHSEGLTPSCEVCHGQDAFRPTAHFDHSQHFPLIGGHVDLNCSGCHVLPPEGTPAAPFPFPFDQTPGRECRQCHKKPHYTAAIQKCEDCHFADERHWDGALHNVSQDAHAITGFRLLGAHAEVDCAKCHPRDLPYAGRYQDSRRPGYARAEDSCKGCHRDVHGGQFGNRHSQCLDCHSRAHFLPSMFGHESHSVLYPLTGSHVAVACIECHVPDAEGKPRKFVGTSHVCKKCHADPHGGQFKKELEPDDCTHCHNAKADTFSIRPFAHRERTGYALVGAHALATCEECHVEVDLGAANPIRKFRGTGQECDTCHIDSHRGQFSKEGGTKCSSCHRSFDSWKSLVFNHNSMSRFPLEGAHAVAACERCHRPIRLPDGTAVVQYKPIGIDCSNCHEILSVQSSRILR